MSKCKNPKCVHCNPPIEERVKALEHDIRELARQVFKAMELWEVKAIVKGAITELKVDRATRRRALSWWRRWLIPEDLC